MKKRLSALRLIGIAALFTASAQAQVAQPGLPMLAQPLPSVTR